MSGTLKVCPKLTVLNRQQIDRLHELSLHVLSSVGMRVDSEQAVNAFVEAAAQAADGRVLLPPDLVQWALDAAPSSIEIAVATSTRSRATSICSRLKIFGVS